MRELVGTSANLALAETVEHKLAGTAEIVLLVSEPQYIPMPGGGFTRSRDVMVYRFATNADALRNTARDWLQLADELDGLVDRASLKPADET